MRRALAIVPAFNEELAVGSLIAEIKAFDPSLEVLVVDDASTDGTAAAARAAGARVVTLPFNLGIGGAVQTGLRVADGEGYELVVRLDGDGQHDPAELGPLIEAIESGRADIAVGSRFVGAQGEYRPSLSRRAGIVWFARLVSLLGGQRVTDTTSGFQALNRRTIALLARDLPTDYPEVEGTLLVVRNKLRHEELPARMRVREHGVSSITILRSAYYLVKVTLALLVARLRRIDGAAPR